MAAHSVIEHHYISIAKGGLRAFVTAEVAVQIQLIINPWTSIRTAHNIEGLGAHEDAPHFSSWISQPQMALSTLQSYPIFRRCSYHASVSD